jgi:putative transposase
MPNHAHLILVPEDPEGLARAVGEAHRRYTLAINTREGWRGYLWQGRFASFPMDSAHLITAVRYVLLNPVRAGLVRKTTDWPHSSARAHLVGSRDGLVDPGPLATRITDWDQLLRLAGSQHELKEFRSHERTGRPMGDDQFVRDLETSLGRRLRLRKVGRKPRR